jgi:hypothetical protein
MTPEEVASWLDAMRRHRVNTDSAAARAIGVSTQTILRMKKFGADRRTAYACRAAYHLLEPWAIEPKKDPLP